MSQTLTAPPTQTRTKPKKSATTVHVMLFGMPDAGKTALLGAFARVAEIQERGLGGRLVEIDDGLRALRRQVYEAKPRETREEILRYVVRMEPFAGGTIKATGAFTAILTDCDGRVASDLVHQASKTGRVDSAGGLAEKVRQADCLIIVVDASADAVQVGADFSQFAKFLKLLRQSRGKQVDVAALPVLLAIAKCDRLAKTGDTASVWAERIEARKEEVADRFRDFLDREDAALFGSLAFQSIATAVRQPALTNAPSRPDEPLGVAELFRAAFGAARDYSSRRVRASRRLRGTLFGLAGLAAALCIFALVMGLARGLFTMSPLAAEVAAYKNREGAPPAGYLEEPLARKTEELVAIAQDPNFGRLSESDRKFVSNRLDELRLYQDFKAKLRAIRPPGEARDDDELAAIEVQLREQSAIPEEYRGTWPASEAGRLRDQRLAEVSAIRAAVTRAVESYDRMRQALERLYFLADRNDSNAASPWPGWAQRAADLLKSTADVPIKPNEPIPVEGQSDSSLTMAGVLVFPEVQKAKDRWLASREKLETQRDIVRALGLGGDGGELKVPETIALDQVPALRVGLKQRYPKSDAWNATDLSDAATNSIRSAAMAEYRRLISPGRLALADAYAKAHGAVESPGKWHKAIEAVAAQPAMKAWNEMAKIYLRLAGADRSDPLTEFTEFLDKESFRIEVQSVRLTIPEDLKAGRLSPSGPWTLTVENVNGETTRLQYRSSGIPERDTRRKTVTYTFAAEGPTRVNYQPGDALGAEVALRDSSGQQWRLSWWTGGLRSRLYQFDRLSRAPQLSKTVRDGDESEPADGILLETRPSGGLPRLPDLMPDVR